MKAILAALAVFTLITGTVVAATQQLDPVRNVALPCEALSTPGLVPRSARNLAHVANVCGFVGTDIEFQSRKAADGKVHDYAFVGTMGGGTRIFDITNPAHPTDGRPVHRSGLPERRGRSGRPPRPRLRLAGRQRGDL